MENAIETVARYLPIIKEMKDRAMAEKVAKSWLQMLEMSPYNDISEPKFATGTEVSMIDHVNSTTELALAMAEILKKYHGLELDKDRLIALGLMHDLDKMIEYVRDEKGEIVHSRSSELIQHGVMSAMVARDQGFDEEMLHLILTHTGQQKMKPAFLEGMLFSYADNADYDIMIKYLGLDH